VPQAIGVGMSVGMGGGLGVGMCGGVGVDFVGGELETVTTVSNTAQYSFAVTVTGRGRDGGPTVEVKLVVARSTRVL
jgi:hypothetical protein